MTDSNQTAPVSAGPDMSKAGPAIFKALAAYQSSATLPVKGASNPHFRSRYADLAEVLGTALPEISRHGLALTQWLSTTPDGVSVTTVLSHESGEWISSVMSARATKPGPQELGSLVTYLRRYAAQAALGLAADDDDGERAEARQAAPAQQPTPAKTAAPAPAPAPAKPKTAAGPEHAAAALAVKSCRELLGWGLPQLSTVIKSWGFPGLTECSTEQLTSIAEQLREIIASNDEARAHGGSP